MSIETQLSACRTLCERKGYKVIAEYADPNRSAYDKKKPWQTRKSFPRVLEHADEADVVVVYTYDRLSRRSAEMGQIVEILEGAGLAVDSVKDPVDPTTAGGRFDRRQRTSIAEYESDRKSELICAAVETNIRKGLSPNPQPRFGYVKTGMMRFEPDPTTGPILATLYKRYADGSGFMPLVRWLNDNEIPTTMGNTWCTQSLISTMDSGFAAGLIKHKGDLYPGAHNALITDEVWTAYQDRRAQRKKQPRKLGAPSWALSGLVLCGGCGSKMVQTSNKKQIRCTRWASSRTCPGVWMSRLTLDNLTEMYVLGWRNGDFRAVMTDDRGAAVEQARAHAQGLERGLERLQQALVKLTTDYATTNMDTEAHHSAQKVLVKQRDEVKDALRLAREELTRLAPPDLDDPDLGGLSIGEFGARIARIIRRIEVGKTAVTYVPVVGEPMTFER